MPFEEDVVASSSRGDPSILWQSLLVDPGGLTNSLTVQIGHFYSRNFWREHSVRKPPSHSLLCGSCNVSTVSNVVRKVGLLSCQEEWKRATTRLAKDHASCCHLCLSINSAEGNSVPRPGEREGKWGNEGVLKYACPGVAGSCLSPGCPNCRFWKQQATL